MADEAQNQPQAQPLNPDLAGYPDTNSLVQGYRNSSEEGKRQRERADKAEALLAQVMAQQLNGANPRQSVPNRATAADRLIEFGIPVDAMREVVGEQIAEAFRPIASGIRARQQIVGAHPDYVQYETDVASFLESDPELKADYDRMFEASPVRAMEYAFLKFGDSRRSTVGQAQANPQGRADAGIPTSRAGEGRRVPPADAQVQEAFERYQKSGSSRDAQAYARARLHGVISDQFLSQ
jgi:hypothetical protein